MARSRVWLAFAGGDDTPEENLIGVYSSRLKARRAVLAYWDFERGKWCGKDNDMLDQEWISDLTDDANAYGYVSVRIVR